MNPSPRSALSGVLVVFYVVLAGKFFGPSTTFARLAASMEGLVAPEHVASLAYFERNGFKVDWPMLFVTGIALGGFPLPPCRGNLQGSGCAGHVGPSLRLQAPLAGTCGFRRRCAGHHRGPHGRWLSRRPWPEWHRAACAGEPHFARLPLCRRHRHGPSRLREGRNWGKVFLFGDVDGGDFLWLAGSLVAGVALLRWIECHERGIV